MLARLYDRNDAQGLDLILNGQGITHQGLDEIFVTGERGKPTGLLVFRPGAFVHELECGNDALSRLKAEALVNFAIGHARAKGLHTGIFLVRGQNSPMLKFVEKLGAIRQTEPGDVLYTLTP